MSAYSSSNSSSSRGSNIVTTRADAEAVHEDLIELTGKMCLQRRQPQQAFALHTQPEYVRGPVL
jgi:hypothetical protein